MSTNQNNSALDLAILDAQELLTTFASDEGLLTNFATAFGNEYNSTAATDLVEQWQGSEFDSFPEIEILTSEKIRGANGAYSADTNKIYLAEELLNSGDVSMITDVVLEEYGHFVDSQINSVDAAGDEGDIFALLVRGQSFTDEQLQELKLENDKAVITLDGEEIAIEQAQYFGDSGNDSLTGSGNADEMRGREGNDSLYGMNGNDSLYGDGGYFYSPGNGNDYLNGGNGNDYLDGGGGNDRLYGEGGNDRLYGTNGDDTLNGGGGLDTLNGGSGADVFEVFDYNYSGDFIGIYSHAIIKNFNAGEGDRVDLIRHGSSSHTYETGNLAGSSALDTIIKSSGDIIAVVADRTGREFIFEVDADFNL